MRKLIFNRKDFHGERFSFEKSHFRNFFYYGNFNFKFFTLLVLREGLLGSSIEEFQEVNGKVYQMAFLWFFVRNLESKSFKGLFLGYRIMIFLDLYPFSHLKWVLSLCEEG